MKARVSTFLASCADDSAKSVALRALTLHMLEHLAPTFFAAQNLAVIQQAALERCTLVDYGFKAPLDAERLEAGVDVWYCRHLKGLPHSPPREDLLRAALESLATSGMLIHAWLIGEQAARCGVDVRVAMRERPYQHVSRLHDAYWLTHLVLLDTDYFARPIQHPQAAQWGDALAELVPWLKENPNEDLAGEVAFCLHFLKRPISQLVDENVIREDAHTQATMLLALAAE